MKVKRGKRGERKQSRSSLICSMHFKPDDFLSTPGFLGRGRDFADS